MLRPLDTEASISMIWPVCPRCGKPPTPKGYDPCIADLPDIRAACCGHGKWSGHFVTHSGIKVAANNRRVKPETLRRYLDLVRRGEIKKLPANVQVSRLPATRDLP
jgi:hypothetical protein